MNYSYTKDELLDYLYDALEFFNDHLDTDLTKETVKVDFFTPQNGVEVYERFCKGMYEANLNEPYNEPGYFETFAAQAFVNGAHYGILIREDIDFPREDLFQVLMHEISHLYCTSHEIPGGGFFDKYCMGSGPEDGMMNAGYAIWREAVADIMTDSMLCEEANLTLSGLKKTILDCYGKISFSSPSSKTAMSLVIVYVMVAREVSTTEDWGKAEKAIKKVIAFDDPLTYAILKLIFDQLHHRPFWEITSDFIMELGELYVNLVTGRLLKQRISE